MICALLLLGLPRQDASVDLPPWLQVNEPTLKRMYSRGIADAGRSVKVSQIQERVRRSIGTIDGRPLPEEAESYVWLVDPFIQAYQFGWHARHDDWDSARLKEANDRLTAWGSQGRKKVMFQFLVNVLRPAPGGPAAAPATPKIFRDLQVVMKIAGRRYFPERQPGDLTYLAAPGAAVTKDARDIPPPPAGVPIGPGETYAGGTSTTNYFTVYRTNKFDYYQGHFSVVFDLYDADGKPRVRPNDVGIGAILITEGADEHQAVYGWNDLMKVRAEEK